MRSKQPRFKSNTGGDLFSSLMNWPNMEDAPVYSADSRKRDAWLRKFIQTEPNLSGVFSTVVAIDKNRGWRMIGGKNQVSRYANILHSIEVAPGVRGWRPAISYISQAFWSSDMGGLLEVGREGRNGPLRGLFTIDPARCKLTGDINKPLTYFPRQGQSIPLTEEDYVRISSLPFTDEAYHGLGFCAVSRCLELAKIMLAVYQHDKEELGALAPRGLLLLNGIGKKQWNDAMEARSADLEGKNLEYFSKVAVLASSAATVDAKMVALSQLPQGWDLREWMDMLMYGYALCFGYDPSEFWPVQFGAIGRGTETEIQHEKATGKGRLDCVLSMQEQLQEDLPDSLEFLFDQRDEKGDLLHAEVHKAWSDQVKVLKDGGLITAVEGRVLLADQGILPRAWAEDEDFAADDLEEDQEGDESPDEPDEDEEGADKDKGEGEGTEKVDPSTVKPLDSKEVKTKQEDVRDLLLSMPRVVRAIEKYPTEPLVEYSFPDHRYTYFAERAEDLLRRRSWGV